MSRTVLLIIWKDVIARNKGMYIFFALLYGFFFGIVFGNPKMEFGFLSGLIFAGMMFAAPAVTPDFKTLVTMKYDKVLLTNFLPVSRKEIVIARFLETFLGCLLFTILWEIISIITLAFNLSISSVFVLNVSELAWDWLVVAILLSTFLIAGTFIEKTFELYVLGMSFALGFLILPLFIQHFLILRHPLSNPMILVFVLLSLMVMVIGGRINYLVLQKRIV